jgi:hypothetical protein
VLALKIHSFPLRYCKSFVHCSGRSWDITRYTHRLIGCSRVPDDLFQDKIPESLPKGGKRDNKLEWHKVRGPAVLCRGEWTQRTLMCVCVCVCVCVWVCVSTAQ